MHGVLPVAAQVNSATHGQACHGRDSSRADEQTLLQGALERILSDDGATLDTLQQRLFHGLLLRWLARPMWRAGQHSGVARALWRQGRSGRTHR
jgi:hypothetical protein